MDPITTAAPVQPHSDPEPWEGLGFRMEAVPGQAPAAAAGGEGEGGGGQDDGLDGLIDLSTYPEELHDVAKGIAKQVQGNVTKRFQEHADFRKTWEPYSQIEGLTSVEPEQMKELLTFAQIAGDPAQFDEWLTDMVGLIAEKEPDRAEALFGRLEQAGLLAGDGDEGEEEGGDGLTADSIREMFGEMLDERLGPIEEQVTTASQQGRVDAARQELEGELAKTGETHQGEFDGKAVLRLAQTFPDAETAKDAIQAGYQEWLRITGQAEGNLIDEKLSQPKPGPTGGRADTTPEQFSAGDPDLKKAALARMRAG